MISSSLLAEHPHPRFLSMSFGTHPHAHPPPPVPEFLRPLPKPAPLTAFPSSVYDSRLFPPPPPPPPFGHPYPPYGGLYYAPYREQQPQQPPPPLPAPASAPAESPPGEDKRFKVPCGKEGSLKHRILTRPAGRKKSAEQSDTDPANANRFNRGSLIRLANGELRRVEDMRTEDFVDSAERSSALRLDPSTVVRIDHNNNNNSNNSNSDRLTLTISYGSPNNQVELSSAAGHPYFVYGRGWASCDPSRSLALYGLRCHRLRVGDVCISLSPRATNATTNAAAANASHKKRRWSAPDQFCTKKAKE